MAVKITRLEINREFFSSALFIKKMMYNGSEGFTWLPPCKSEGLKTGSASETELFSDLQ